MIVILLGWAYQPSLNNECHINIRYSGGQERLHGAHDYAKILQLHNLQVQGNVMPGATLDWTCNYYSTINLLG